MAKIKRQPMEEEYWTEKIATARREERQACIQVVQDLMERTSYSDGHVACRAIRDALKARGNGQS